MVEEGDEGLVVSHDVEAGIGATILDCILPTFGMIIPEGVRNCILVPRTSVLAGVPETI